ncbi:23291_t:CDS:2, partial [Gigaspora rosea]
DQDPMTWLDEVEKAFAANLENDDRKIFSTQFYCSVSHLCFRGKWFAQLATRKQQVNKDVDTYHSAVQ